MNGKVRQDIYANLRCKQHYLSTMSKIQQCLKPYKHFRFTEEQLNPEINTGFDIHNKKCKWFYNKIVALKQKNSKVPGKWKDEFQDEPDWSVVFVNKVTFQLEIKIAEFNFKFLNNFLPTKDNLYRWKKSDSPICTFCNQHIHDRKHLLWDCADIRNVWCTINSVTPILIDWKLIVTGSNSNKCVNKVVSLICYLIYKKYLADKDKHQNLQNSVQPFLKSELFFRLRMYSDDICDLETRQFITSVANVLHSV